MDYEFLSQEAITNRPDKDFTGYSNQGHVNENFYVLHLNSLLINVSTDSSCPSINDKHTRKQSASKANWLLVISE